MTNDPFLDLDESGEEHLLSQAWNGPLPDEHPEETRHHATAPLDELIDESAPPEPGMTGSVTPDLEAVMNIPVTVSMEIGRTKINIRNLLQLNQGSVVELDQLAGEPLDVMANGTLIAHGEVVVVNEKFGIRLTDVISAQERVKKLR